MGVLGTVGVSAALGASQATAQQAVLTDAVAACGSASAPGITLGDDGQSLTFDMQGEDELTGANVIDVYCLFSALEMPASVDSHIGQTTSMDGRQSATWGNLEIQWSYHPDRGLDGVITVVDD
ncbi:hypothetical protein [Serinibacter salmoneus]|uniref:hypothetical protein n=1 Tax=Serinibacter salmoneus TaxID=556530 RepID=UPI000BF4AEED|nr:hypothetical protein [Serinibacter salmoneus]